MLLFDVDNVHVVKATIDTIDHTRNALIIHLSSEQESHKRIRFVIDAPPSPASSDELQSADDVIAVLIAAGTSWAEAVVAHNGPAMSFVGEDDGNDAAIVHVHFAPLDGPGDMLAWTGEQDGAMHMYFDTWHRWTAVSDVVVVVFCGVDECNDRISHDVLLCMRLDMCSV